MLLAVELILLIGTLALIGYPLAQRISSGGEGLVENELSDLLYKRDTLFIALKDLEFDRATGKVDDEDYTAMKEQFKEEAMVVLKKIDDVKEG